MRQKQWIRKDLLRFVAANLLAVLICFPCSGTLVAQTASGPSPLLDPNTKVEWWFVFKFNAEAFPQSCAAPQRACPFGGHVQPYQQFSQQFVYASSTNHTLQQGGGCLGGTTTDPLGATFNQVYTGNFFFVLWNDQFYGDPILTEGAPWGHSKGMLAWDQNGNGLVLQVSTPDWPGSGSQATPRNSGNTLGCIRTDNNIMVSQHFFSLQLNKDDVVIVLKALANASVLTDPSKPQIVKNGGPAEIRALVEALGKESSSKVPTKDRLSSGIVLISKPSKLNVPPWQMVSAMLGGEPLRAATWWTKPEIPTTTASTVIGCWDASLGKPGAVEIATSGTWNGKTIGLEGLAEPNGNHAKVGVSTGSHTYAIFGDMNQQGSLAPPRCPSSQNGRGGLFYVVDDAPLFHSVQDLIKASAAPSR